MDKLTSFVEEKIAPPLIRFSQIRYVQVMQRMGLGIMSLLIIGSLFLILASFPYQPYLEFLGEHSPLELESVLHLLGFLPS